MLQLTAAAGAIVRTEGGLPVGRRGQNLNQRAALAFARDGDLFTRQGKGHENTLAIDMGNALALVAEVLDFG
jgi:hypothetical protein